MPTKRPVQVCQSSVNGLDRQHITQRMLQYMGRGSAQERLHRVMPVAAHGNHIGPAVADKLGYRPDRCPFQEVPALQRNLMMVTQAVERGPLRAAARVYGAFAGQA